METLALKRIEKRLLEATEMQMLRWISGISPLEHCTSKDIRQIAKIASISDKARKARLRWLGHVIGRKDGNVLQSIYQARVEGRRSRGTEKLRYKDKVERDMKELGLCARILLDRGE